MGLSECDRVHLPVGRSHFSDGEIVFWFRVMTTYYDMSETILTIVSEKIIENTHNSRYTNAGGRYGVGWVIGVSGLVGWRYWYADEQNCTHMGGIYFELLNFYFSISTRVIRRLKVEIRFKWVSYVVTSRLCQCKQNI